MQAPNRGGSSDREQELERRVESLERQLQQALAEMERLRRQLEEALRANKRSAAPFSKGDPKPDPKLPGRLDRLLDQRFRHPANRRLAKHLRHELPHLFQFLRCPGLPATNNFAERAIRLMAIARKTWGGNRTAHGARTQQILASVLRTCWQQGRSGFDQLVKLLRSARPILLEIVPAELSP